jgi:hypothetical protein
MLKGIKTHDYAPGHLRSIEYPHDSTFIVNPLQKAASVDGTGNIELEGRFYAD